VILLLINDQLLVSDSAFWTGTLFSWPLGTNSFCQDGSGDLDLPKNPVVRGDAV
jgi:hypothetical protein